MIIDIHAHYDDQRFDGDRHELISSLQSQNILIINAGCDLETSTKAKEISDQYENVYFTAGVHPHNAEKCFDFEEWLIPLTKHPKCVAIGEIGLDYHYPQPDRDIQKQVFYRQLDLALSLGKPVVIHDREAHQDCVDAVLSRKGIRGAFHSFSGSAETAKILRKAGIYISFSGVVTFKNAEKTHGACIAVDDNGLLSETDAPYLTPHPHRGERNDSSYIRLSLEKMAELRGTTVEHLCTVIQKNTQELFSIKL